MTDRSSHFLSRSLSACSGDGGSLAELTPQQRERLTEVLDRYLSALEHDAPLDQDALLAEHPDLAEALRAYFRSLEDLHDMAAGFAGATSGVESPAEMQHDSAKRIGDFELIREIGRGGMGVVYEARQISLDRRVAVKLLPFAAVLDAKQIARFKHEAQAAAQLHHPNIVPVFAVGVERGVHYYAMQYIDGQPLDRAIEGLQSARSRRVPKGRTLRPGGMSSKNASRFGESPVPSCADETKDQRSVATHAGCLASVSRDKSDYYRAVTRLGIQAAEALNAAHEYGVVHRDVKPSNLLLAADGKLWITDFGLARCQRDASLTRTGDLIGTMRYMSPEQAAGNSALVDHRTDIYSLGITLYELVCLQPAFAEDRGPALLRQIDNCDPPAPRRVRPDIPADLETVILKAMSRERDDRYGTAQQLADDLKCVLEGKAITAKPPTLVDRVGRWSRRHARLAAAVLGTLLAAVMLLSTSTVMIGRQTQRANANADSADRRFRGALEILNQLGMPIAEQLADVPDADPVRKQLLADTRRFYLLLIEESKSDPVLRTDAALAYGKIGALLDVLGSAAESLEAHEQAAKMLGDLAATNGHDFATERQLALAENNVGLAQRRLGQNQQARQQFEQAIRRQEKLLARATRNSKREAELASELESELAVSTSNLGLIQYGAQQSAAAQASFEDAIGRLRRVLTDQPASPSHRRQLAAVYNNLAAIYRQERPAESARLHRQALDLLQAIAPTSTADLALRRELGATYNNLASAYARLQQHSPALTAYEQAIGISEQLVQLAPARAAYRTDLAMTLNNLGMFQTRLGRMEDAEVALRRSRDLYESLLNQFPHDPAIQSNLGGVYNNLGVTLEGASRMEDAEAAFSSAVKYQRAACDLAPDSERFRELLIKHYEGQGRVLGKLGRVEDARQATLALERITSLPNSNRRQP